MTAIPTCFKAYDIRGRVPEDLDADLAYNIGRAFVAQTGAGTVCIGRDIRTSSEELSAALAKGLNAGGADVIDIGLCGTEQIYYTTFAKELDGGIMVTASHNPLGYNGMKLVREQSKPISRRRTYGRDTGRDQRRRLHRLPARLRGYRRAETPEGRGQCR